MIEAALNYAKKGISIFPVNRENKRPLTKNGFLDATKDERTIKEWWKRYPEAMIGCPCGEVNGNIIAIDLDNHANGENGVEWARHWQDNNGELPETVQVITPTGGYHCYYKAKPEFIKDYGSTINREIGIDTRGNGGYVVLPPSENDKGVYQYVDEFWMAEAEPTEANDIVYKFLYDIRPTKIGEKAPELPEVIKEGDRNRALFTEGSRLRRLGFTETEISKSLKMLNSTRCNVPLEDKEIESIVKSIMKYPKGEKYNTTTKNGVIVPVEDVPDLSFHTAKELVTMNLPAPEFLVDGLIPMGIGIIAAPSKMGKSWLMLDLGAKISKGEPFLGFKTNKHDVLYMALEDSEYRLKDRLLKQSGTTEPEQGYRITTESKRLKDGLIEQLKRHCQQYADTKLIIIDTLQMIRPPKGQKDAYEYDYEMLGMLQGLTKELNICILLVHHTRKTSGRETDPFENILGSTALQGATDFMLVIQKEKREDECCSLFTRGRDTDSKEICIKFNKQRFIWQNLGNLETVEEERELREYQKNPIVKTVKQKLEEKANNPEDIIKSYTITSTDLTQDVYDTTSRTLKGNIGTTLNKLKPLLQKYDGITFSYGSTTYNGQKGRFYQFYNINA